MQNKDTTATVINAMFKRYVMLSKLNGGNLRGGEESLKKGQGSYRDGGWRNISDRGSICSGQVEGWNMAHSNCPDMEMGDQ